MFHALTLLHKNQTRLSGLVVFSTCFAYLLYSAPTSDFFLKSIDHGYQLAMAQAVLNGKLPGIDFFTLYGPLVAYSSALARLVTGSIVGELILCSFGYALAICIGWYWVQRFGGKFAGLFFVLGAIGVLPRFYKWYFWLFPLANLSMYSVICTRNQTNKTILMLWGIIGGIAFLYRVDLSASFIILFCLSVLLGSQKEILNFDTITFFSGFVLPPLIYLCLIVIIGGIDSLYLFISIGYESVIDLVTHYSGLSEFRGTIYAARSPGSIIILFINIATSIAAILWTSKTTLINEPKNKQFILGVSVMALCISYQAYRTDIAHIQQMILFYIILGCTTISAFVPSIKNKKVSVLTFSAVATSFIWTYGFLFCKSSTDLNTTSRDWFAYIEEMMSLPESREDTPEARIALKLKMLNKMKEPIFTCSKWSHSPILFFSDSYLSGLFPAYVPNFLVSPRLNRRNGHSLQQHAPQYLVVRKERWANASPMTLAPYITAVVNRWRKEYTIIEYETGGYQILSKH